MGAYTNYDTLNTSFTWITVKLIILYAILAYIYFEYFDANISINSSPQNPLR